MNCRVDGSQVPIIDSKKVSSTFYTYFLAKIPSEMEVATRYKMLTLLTLLALTWFSLWTWGLLSKKSDGWMDWSGWISLRLL